MPSSTGLKKSGLSSVLWDIGSNSGPTGLKRAGNAIFRPVPTATPDMVAVESPPISCARAAEQLLASNAGHPEMCTKDEINLTLKIVEIADFIGWQDDFEGGEFQMWNLRKAIPGRALHSTVVRATLKKYFAGAK